MKKLFYTLLLLLAVQTSFAQGRKKAIAMDCSARGCSGSDYCTVCKNCSGCKHCAKNGGTCGVCAPPKKAVAKPKKVKKKTK